MVSGDIYSTLQWLHDSGPATIQAAYKETYIALNKHFSGHYKPNIVFASVYQHYSKKNLFFVCANFAISRAEALDIFDQFICQELGCKSRAQSNV